MNIADIIALAKMGYKKQDIKDLIDMADSKELPPSVDAVSQSDCCNPVQITPEVTPEGEAPEPSAPIVKFPENTAKEPAQPENDEKVKQLEEQIKKLQEANTRKDASGNVESDADAINDLVRSYM